MDIHRILCPVDLTPFSRRALEHAAALARCHDAQLTVFHVTPLYPTILGFPQPVGLKASEKDPAREELDRFVAHTIGQPNGLRYELRVGDPASEILQHAGETAPDLIVMGTHGRSGFDRILLGSITAKILHKASCPVLTVPRQADKRDAWPYKHIVCAVDFSRVSRHAADCALSLSRKTQATLALLHVVEPLPHQVSGLAGQPDPAAYLAEVSVLARARLEQMAAAAPSHLATTRIACGKPYREIARAAELEHADLVVMGVHGHGALDNLLFGSTTERVLRQAACPVLTVRCPPGAELAAEVGSEALAATRAS